jgi:hypothetical protein
MSTLHMMYDDMVLWYQVVLVPVLYRDSCVSFVHGVRPLSY